MKIANAEIPNDMVEMYVRAVKNVRTSPTRATDVARVEIHNRIIEEANTTRHDHVFMGALSDTVMELIEPMYGR